MASDRTRARKKIRLPSGDEIYIPVLVKLSVIDQNGQETELTIDNTASNSTRRVHTDNVKAHPDVGGTLAVERIDGWIGLDLISQAQESEFLIDNKTGADSTPPSFTTHQKTHVYRYYKDPNNSDDGGVWVDSELIDEISVVDQNGQEHIYFLLGNPAAGDSTGQSSPDDPDITGGGGSGIDPSYRTDPFQNVVNWHGGGGILLQWTYTLSDVTVHLPGAGNIGPLSIPVSGLLSVAGQYISSVSIDLTSSPTLRPGITVSGTPSVSPTNFSLGAWADIAGGGVTSQLTIGTSVSLSVFAGPPIMDLGEGYYGDPAVSPIEGLLGHGATQPGIDTIGTVNINASAISVSDGSTTWTRTYAEISSGGGGGFTISQVFSP